MTPPLKYSLRNRLWMAVLMFVCRVGTVAFLKIRCHRCENLPRTGPGMVLSNHQSYLDPIAAAVACPRRMSAVARQTLFRFALFRWLIDSLGAFPLDQDGSGLSGVKQWLKHLRQGELMLIYPEGARTFDGQLLPLKPGFAAVARRARVPLVPLAIDGALQAWPRWQLLPGGGVIQVQFGPPIQPDDLDGLSDEQLAAEAARRMQDCLDEARRRRIARCSRWQRMVDQAVYRASARVKRDETGSVKNSSAFEQRSAV